MSDWETASEARLWARRVIRRVIDDWVHGPVELLPPADVQELRRVLRGEWHGPRRGWRYVAWRAEVNLALGKDGALAPLRGKSPVRKVRPEQVMASTREWLGRQKRARVEAAPEQRGDVMGEMRGGE